MDREDTFPLWAVLVGVAAGGCFAYMLANPRGKTLLRNLPRVLADLTRQSERMLALVRDLTGDIEQSLQKVEAGLESVQQTLERESISGEPAPQQSRAA